MIAQQLTVYDAVAARYHTPFFAPTVEFAKRSFTELVNTPGHQFNNHSADYTLFHIGTFDHEKADVVPNGAPIKVATALEVKIPDVAVQLTLEDEVDADA